MPFWHPEPTVLESLPPADTSLGPTGNYSSRPLECPNCGKEFSKNHELTKHMKNHVKPLICAVCQSSGAAEKKDLHRHYWVHHPEYARENGIPKEEKTCPDCGHTGRSDNIKRHWGTCHKV
ncbi:hypothetical protein B0O99DRAFT_600067 [Bisporella sp. PMI_857]|nr:hypothetical protein B0O99DRAFT_600067 [Bisporella sp. PMI_857]